MLSVYCILEVKYCITGVHVYIEMNFVDKTWLIFHTWWHFSALLTSWYHIAKEVFQVILAGGNNVHFPHYHFYMYECVCLGSASLFV